MKGGLFWRTYSVMAALLLVTILIFSGVLVAARQQGVQDSYEAEVRQQAREVADYMASLNQLSYVQRNTTMKNIILRKINECLIAAFGPDEDPDAASQEGENPTTAP